MLTIDNLAHESDAMRTPRLLEAGLRTCWAHTATPKQRKAKK
jgi:hypothetical protein